MRFSSLRPGLSAQSSSLAIKSTIKSLLSHRAAYSRKKSSHITNAASESEEPSEQQPSSSSSARKRVLSGVQPTGRLHLGNYMGAIKNWVGLQEDYDTYFCVVDLHAITVPHDPVELKSSTRTMAATYLAAGIDPARSKVFVQSHISAHAELQWLLNCVTPIGWLNRMIQFKEKARKQGEEVRVSLYS